MDELQDEFPCDGYDGQVYDIMGPGVDYVAPEHEVALNTVTYIQGVGMNMRTVSVPGSAVEMYMEVTEPYGVCACLPPAVWVFTGVATDGSVAVVHVLNGHDAVHLMRHPDHIFDGSQNGVGIMTSDLRLVPPEHGLEMVFQESKEHLASQGVPDLIEEGAIRYDEIAVTDLEDMFAKFFENEEGDGENSNGR